MTQVEEYEMEESIPLSLDTGAQKGEYGVIFEDPPELVRVPPKARRTAFDWGTALEPIRQRKNEWAHFVAYPDNNQGRAAAQSKAQAVKKSLMKLRSNEHWDVKVRRVEGENRVYARFNGLLTPAQEAERDRIHKERGDAIRKAKGTLA